MVQFSSVSSPLGKGLFWSLNLSSGFLNFLLWAANLWFLYKETSWFGGGKQVQEMDAVRIEENPMESKSEDN